MPITIRPSSNAAESWDFSRNEHGYRRARSAEEVLASITTDDNERLSRKSSTTSWGSSSDGGGGSGGGGGGGFSGGSAGPSGSSSRKGPRRGLIQSSLSDLGPTSSRTNPVVPTKNGLVHACIEAYNDHHNLVLRPEDVWFAILTQLSVYVNANAESLRSLFVENSGQKELHIEVELEGLDHGAMAFQMTKLMASSLKDPALRDWILPGFSTTEKPDQAVASIIFMGTMQKYFTYSWGTRCGIPEVTLLGEAADWVEIARRCSERLGTGAFGPGAQEWYRVLRPVLAGFVETFRDSEGKTTTRFWQSIVDEHKPNGSGSTTYSGWVTAFCYWDEKGDCLHASQQVERTAKGRVALTRSQIPMGFAKVPVTLWDNGVSIPTEMLAGSVGLRIAQPEGSKDFNTVHPESGYFMYYV